MEDRKCVKCHFSIIAGRYYACNEMECRKKFFCLCLQCYSGGQFLDEGEENGNEKQSNENEDGDDVDFNNNNNNDSVEKSSSSRRSSLHEHPLIQFEFLPAKVLFKKEVEINLDSQQTSKTKTTRSILLSNVGAALPSSEILKNQNIVAVLTLLDFRGALGFDSTIMKSLFAKKIKKKNKNKNKNKKQEHKDGENNEETQEQQEKQDQEEVEDEEPPEEIEDYLLQKTTLSPDGKVAYHLIHLPDTSTPDVLRLTWKMSPSAVLYEACAWIQEALKYGNILVQKRISLLFFFPLLTLPYMSFVMLFTCFVYYSC
jgi:hypothetical protein